MARRKSKSNVKKSEKKVLSATVLTKTTYNSIKDDPGGSEDDVLGGGNHSKFVKANNEVLLNRTNGFIDEHLIKSTSATLYSTSSALSEAISVSSTAAVAAANNNNNNNKQNNNSTISVTNQSTNDTNNLKYLHKKFKRIASATLDSNINSNFNENNFLNNNKQEIVNKNTTAASTSSHPFESSSIIATTATATTTTISSSAKINCQTIELKSANTTTNDNNRLIRNSYLIQQTKLDAPAINHHQFSTTTEEEKQLVKDIITQTNPPSSSTSSSSSDVPFVAVNTFNNNNNNSSNNQFQQNCVQIIQNRQQSPVTLQQQQQQQQQQRFNDSSNFAFSKSGNNFVIYQNSSSDLQPEITALKPLNAVTTTTTISTSNPSTPGRHICPYCQLNCAKPSVLQKHIRAHTNERPYPCTLCGFAFKTKSNLYKHCRSRAHIQRCQGDSDPTNFPTNPITDEDGSLESADIDESESSNLDTMNRLSSPTMMMESGQMNGENSSSSSSSSMFPSNSNQQLNSNENSSNSTSSASLLQKPYKPKFHNYKKLDLTKTQAVSVSSTTNQSQLNHVAATTSLATSQTFFKDTLHPLTTQNIEQRISKIISENEAIIEEVEPPLQKKYHKITGMQRNMSSSSLGTIMPSPSNESPSPQNSNSKLALALQKQQQQQRITNEEYLKYQMQSAQQPLNLTKIQEPLTIDVSCSSSKKRSCSETLVAPLVVTTDVVEKPHYTPPSQLVVAASHPQNPEGSIIKDLLLNSKNFGVVPSDGESDGTYTCQTCKLSFRGADILKYHLICHCQGEENILSKSASISPSASPNSVRSEKTSPNSLKNLATSTLKQPQRNPSSLLKLAKSQIKIPKQKPENIQISPAISSLKQQPIQVQQTVIKNPLPSPGPLLGNTRLVESRFDDDIPMKRIKYSDSMESRAMSSLFGEIKKNYAGSSGGSFITVEQIKDENSINETSPSLMQKGLSGGTALKRESPTTPTNEPPPVTPKLFVTITPTLAPTLTTQTFLFSSSQNSAMNNGKMHFQFPPPPISSISSFNPLMSNPGSIVYGGKVIPYVPGIPGPNTLVNKSDLPPPPIPIKDKRNISPSMKPNGFLMSSLAPPSPVPQPPPPQLSPQLSPKETKRNGLVNRDMKPPQTNATVPSQQLSGSSKKSFNFIRIADNNLITSPRKKSPESFNFSETTAVAGTSVCSVSETESKPNKPSFLRPNSLPLKPGTFTPKRHHGITPTANTLPLISPETPRPSKSCVQLYLNGHAYTYLGLKSSTKPFYCTVNKPQPSYIQGQHRLSMYSNWQIYTEQVQNQINLNLPPYASMSLYDSRQRPQTYAVAEQKDGEKNVMHFSITEPKNCSEEAPTKFRPNALMLRNLQVISPTSTPSTPTSNLLAENVAKHNRQQVSAAGGNSMLVPAPISTASTLSGGFESNEEYTYVRGRGRGKYVCSECGIRCKKPSMLKKHIRTHTDVRPYTCQYCEFSFKTKGNLTKHMKSKAHYKKCTELGLNPIPTSLPDDDGGDFDDSASMTSEKTSDHRRNSNASLSKENESRLGDSDSDDGDDSDDGETDSDDTDESKSRLPEHEAAHCLLSLSMTPTHSQMIAQPSAVNPQFVQYENTVGNWKNQQPSPSSVANLSEPMRRVIFTNSKTGEFDLLNHEQYYSDPNLNKMKMKDPILPNKVEKAEIVCENEDLIPMDLTKKPRMEKSDDDSPLPINVSNVIAPISEPALLLNTLVSITEKIPSQSNCRNLNFTDSVQYGDGDFRGMPLLPHEYITEVALKESKIKQSQHMSKINEYHHMVVSTAGSSSTIFPEKFQLYQQVKAQQQEEDQKPTVVAQQTKSQKSSSSTSASSSSASVFENQSQDQQSRMDTLAELAAKSDKLEVKQNSLLKNSGDSSTDKRNSSDNAKSVASEYLKLTKQTKQKNYTEVESYSSDQESVGGQVASSNNVPNNNSEMGMNNNMVMVQTVVVGEDGFRKKLSASSTLPNNDALLYSHMQDDGGRPICSVCQKVFQKISHLRIHMNIHYMERKYRCEPCAVSFRTQGHLLKHERSVSHQNKVSMTSTFGVPTVTNPRPFKCKDCKIAFRIHGHLAKHLRSKMHVLKLECLQKLPFGTYAEMERSGFNFTGIDTSDCDSSLMSLRELAKKLNEKDPSKIGPLPPLYNDDTDADAELNDLVNGINDNYDSDSSDIGELTNNNPMENLNSTNELLMMNDDGKLKRTSDKMDADNNSSDNNNVLRNGDNPTNKKIRVTTTILTSSSIASGSNTTVTTSSVIGFIGNKSQ